MKEEVYTKNAPEPVGPYSQAVKTGDVVYVSGQIGLDPETSELVGETFEDEVKQVFENLSHILEAAEGTMNDVVRVDIFLMNMDQFELVNQIYKTWLGDVDVLPVRQTIEVSKLPKSASLEVSCIAHVNS